MLNYYKQGDWNTICDSCGFKFKASELRQRWDGFMVCNKDYELRNPQDFLRVTTDEQAPSWTRPEAIDTFVGQGVAISTESDEFILTELGLTILT